MSDTITTASTTVNVGSYFTLTFNPSAAHTGYKWRRAWRNPDTMSDEPMPPTILPDGTSTTYRDILPSAGIYKYYLEYTSSAGPQVAMIVITCEGIVDRIVSTKSLVTPGQTFMITAPFGATSYTWTKDGITIQSGSSNMYTNSLSAVGSATYFVTYTKDGNTMNIEKTIYCFEYPAFNMIEETTGSIPTGQTFILFADPGLETYTFTKDGVTLQSSSSNTYTTSISSAGTITYSMTGVTNGGFNIGTTSIAITASGDGGGGGGSSGGGGGGGGGDGGGGGGTPTQTFDVTTTSTGSVTVGEIFALSAPTGLTTYTFKKDGVTLQSSSSNTYTTSVSSAGTYIYEVTGIHPTAGNINVGSITITATGGGGGGGIPTQTFDVTTTSTGSVTVGEIFALSAPTGLTTYTFKKDGVTLQSSSSNTYTTSVSSAGTYIYEVTGIHPTAGNINVGSITITASSGGGGGGSTTSYDITTTSTGTVTVGESFTLTTTLPTLSPGQTVEYKWYVGTPGGTPINTTSSYTTSLSAAGSEDYYCLIRVLNSDGTTASETGHQITITASSSGGGSGGGGETSSITIISVTASKSSAQVGESFSLACNAYANGTTIKEYRWKRRKNGEPTYTVVATTTHPSADVTLKSNTSGAYSYGVEVASDSTPEVTEFMAITGEIIFAEPTARFYLSNSSITLGSPVTLTNNSNSATFLQARWLYTVNIDGVNQSGEIGIKSSYETIIQFTPPAIGRYAITLELLTTAPQEVVTSTGGDTVTALAPAISPVTVETENYDSVNKKVTAIFNFAPISHVITYALIRSDTEQIISTSVTSPIRYFNADPYTTLPCYIVGRDANGYEITARQSEALSILITCLPRGTRILTPSGLRLVEEFADGDLVTTEDGREVPVKVHRSSTACSNAKSAPVQIAAGTFFGKYPIAPIRVSPWHAFKVGDPTENAWILPKDVIGIDGVIQEPFGQAVEYYHFELPEFLRDNLVLEGGAVVESYGIPWIKQNWAVDKPVYIMDQEAGYCRRITGSNSGSI